MDNTSAEGRGQLMDNPNTQVGQGDAQSGIMGQVRERANAQLAAQKDRATEGLGTVAQAVRQSTQQLRDQNHESVANYIDKAADQLERFSSRLKEKDINELIDDAQQFARRQPAIFIGSAFALGLLGARFLKSSSEDARRGSGGYQPRTAGQYGSVGGYGTSGSFRSASDRTSAPYGPTETI
jgi:hypothetical protein